VPRNLNRMLTMVRNNINEHGVHLQWIPDGEPSFAYTVGLAPQEHPELIIFNVQPQMVESLLNNFAFRVRDGVQTFTAGTLVDGLIDNYSFYLMPVKDSSEHLTVSNRFYRIPGRAPIDALQVVQPGLNRLWPWEEGCDIPQPLLGDAPQDMRSLPHVALLPHEP
jgi:hypothetical protein